MNSTTEIVKLEYVIRQIAKTNKKNYENYVITRIWHGINLLDVKFITQQYVVRPDGYALTDMYFPQFDLHIEVDEPFHHKQKEMDMNREVDVIQATNHIFKRVKINNDIIDINQQIDVIVQYIIEKRQELIQKNAFEIWNLREFDPKYHQEKGYLEVSENPAFRTIVNACNCLGQNYVEAQKAYYASKVYKNYYLWFPKFYENEAWDNKISADGTEIFEKCKNLQGMKQHFENITRNPTKRIVFPRCKDNLGFTLYRFKGVFEVDFDKSSPKEGMVYKRVATKFEINK